MNPSHSTPTEAREEARFFTPAAFTPGPWSATKATDTLDLPVYEIHGDESRMKLCTWVATVHETQVNQKVAEANARLIAAAPALLEALKACAEAMLVPDDLDAMHETRQQALRALQTANA